MREAPAILVAKASSTWGSPKMSTALELTMTIIKEDSEDSNWPPDNVKDENTLARTRFMGLRKNLKLIIMKIILNLGISLFDFLLQTFISCP